MRKSFLFGVLAFFAVSAMSIQSVEAQNPVKKATTEKKVEKKSEKAVTADSKEMKKGDCCAEKKATCDKKAGGECCESKKVAADQKKADCCEGKKAADGKQMKADCKKDCKHGDKKCDAKKADAKKTEAKENASDK